jgi:RNA polymerase-associated protein
VPILWRLPVLDIKLPERTTKSMQRYMQFMFERPSFRESLTEAELEMRE